ncbi:type II toxin-antitoxin system death-on-curing family toxin [Paenibacillus motobuensis]|uniref:type II toxin-antitoxin system death-on-curing family toxin n=1 Tax=Paenibacillus TaxID=44249 RepID=UPI00203CF2E9|nr:MULTISPECIES: type II toxin-antitoxin system death-on-curing family toxin [Paenibacillus]MCM3041515.1 type II toxin-antitoxin system death-on-curing family toxin [Paenibacillus lutimineralis]MCM3648619.1 type II toxin-antitoxin system death-on-curing family toxin [Paenibacillus motobuensis]
MTVRYLSVQEVIAINVAMIQKYSPREDVGVKDGGMLESAVFRPQSSAFGEEAYPSLFGKAAALFQSLGQNHAFQNANKRTAFTALVIFLRLNGCSFVMDQKAAEDFTVNMVNHHYEFQELTQVIQQYCKRIQQ